MTLVETHQPDSGYYWIPTLDKVGAKRIGTIAIRIAEEIGVSGITIIRSRTRQLLYSELAGDTEREMFEYVANSKLITTLNFFRPEATISQGLLGLGGKLTITRSMKL